MKSANPYLNFNGDAEEAFNLYQSVFGGELMTVRFGDMDTGDAELTEEQKNGVAHIALMLGDSILMGSDVPPQMGGPVTMGDSFVVSLETESVEETDRVFNGLAAGGQESMPLGTVEWAERFGMVTDKFGVQWMVGYTGNVDFKP